MSGLVDDKIIPDVQGWLNMPDTDKRCFNTKVGPLEHKKLQLEVAENLRQQGYKVSVEQPFLNKYVLDILAEKDGKKIAVEVGQLPPPKRYDLPLFIDVYHVPKASQKPIQITIAEVMRTFDNKIEDETKVIRHAVIGLQRFSTNPQKLVIEIMPDGKLDWKFVNADGTPTPPRDYLTGQQESCE